MLLTQSSDSDTVHHARIRLLWTLAHSFHRASDLLLAKGFLPSVLEGRWAVPKGCRLWHQLR